MLCRHHRYVTPEHSITAKEAPFTPAVTPTPLASPTPTPHSLSPWMRLFWTCHISGITLCGLVCPASLTERHAFTCQRPPPFHSQVTPPCVGGHVACLSSALGYLGCSHSCARVREWGSLRFLWEPTRGTAGPRDAVFSPACWRRPTQPPAHTPVAGFPEAWRLRLAGAWWVRGGGSVM